MVHFYARELAYQIKSNHLFRQADTKKNVDKMSNEKAWARVQRAARASYMDPQKTYE